MWQSSMLISLLVATLKQIYVPIWVNHGSFYRGPITLLEVTDGAQKSLILKIRSYHKRGCVISRGTHEVMNDKIM